MFCYSYWKRNKTLVRILWLSFVQIKNRTSSTAPIWRWSDNSQPCWLVGVSRLHTVMCKLFNMQMFLRCFSESYIIFDNLFEPSERRNSLRDPLLDDQYYLSDIYSVLNAQALASDSESSLSFARTLDVTNYNLNNLYYKTSFGPRLRHHRFRSLKLP